MFVLYNHAGRVEAGRMPTIELPFDFAPIYALLCFLYSDDLFSFLAFVGGLFFCDCFGLSVKSFA
jgi:hypothetical protein